VESLAQQLAAFFAVTAAGGAGGLLFDLYRFLRREVPRWGGLVDGLFWLVAGPTMLLLITLANWASLRFYLVVALGLGFFLYAQLLSPLVTWVLLEGSRLFGLGVRGLTVRRAGRGPLAGHPPRPTGHRPAGPGMAAGPPAVADGLGGPGTPLIPGGSPRPAAEQPDRGGPVATRRRFRVTPRFYALLLVLVLVMLGARLVQGWVAEHRLTRELEVLQEQIEARRAEIQRLEAEVAEMQTEAYVERRAREALGLVLPGEERYQVIPAD